jgi:hypothetical protein
MENKMPKITVAVFGAGGVGGYFGEVLAGAGHPVILIARGAHFKAIRKDGLCVSSPKDDFRVIPEQVTSNPAEVRPVDVVNSLTFGVFRRTVVCLPQCMIASDSRSFCNPSDNHRQVASV